MKISTRKIGVVAFAGFLFAGAVYFKLAGAVFGEGVPTLEVQKGGTDNPSWLDVTVAHDEGDLFHIALHAKKRDGIAGYDLILKITSGELKGLYIPVEIIRVKPGYDAGMALPKSLLSKATLILFEHLGAEDGSWDADGGNIYEIDLGSYLSEAKEDDTADKANAPDKK